MSAAAEIPRVARMSRSSSPVYRRRALNSPRMRCSPPPPSRWPSAALPGRARWDPRPLLDHARRLGRLRRDRHRAVFERLGQHQNWWRYFRLPDLSPLVRAAAVASALGPVFSLAKPYAYDLPRSVVVFDFLLTMLLLGRGAARRGG